jgi:hypothetical protein
MFEMIGWCFLRASGYGKLWGRRHYNRNDGHEIDGHAVFGNGNNVLLPLGLVICVLMMGLAVYAPALTVVIILYVILYNAI